MQASMSQLEKAVATTSIASTTPHNTSSSSKKVDLVSAIKSDKSSSVPLAKKKSVSISPNLDAKSSISISNSPKLVVSVFSEESLSTIEDPSAAIANNVEFVCAYLVKALYDFQGTREDDVPFVAGDVLEVSTENGGWCTGRKQGSTQVGWFPRNFVEEYNIANESAQQIFSSPETSTPTPKKIGSAQALYDYDARRADESTMKFGDLVEIVEKTDENWWKIRIKGAVGLVPASYLKEVVTADSTTHAYQKSPTSSIPLSHDGRASISSQKSNSRISVAHDGVENNRLSVLRNSTVDSGGGSGLPRSFSTSLRSVKMNKNRLKILTNFLPTYDTLIEPFNVIFTTMVFIRERRAFVATLC